MVLTLSNREQFREAKSRLIALGIDHQVVGTDPIVFQINTEFSVYRPDDLAEKISDLGQVLAHAEKSPLLDKIQPGHEVVVEGNAFSPIRIKNFAKSIWVAGPCSLDEHNDIFETAAFLKKIGVQILRGGAIKPRTSPHEFQGVGREGYQVLQKAAHANGLACISEALSEDDVSDAVKYLDIIQVGARNMQNFSLLKKLGRSRKPILLKRAPGATLREWALAAEYLLSEGNDKVILCERGVRGLERELRYTLDLAGASFMQHRYGLPVMIDPSHATGLKQILESCTAGAIAMGFAGVMLETHPDPIHAKSDALQALSPQSLAKMAERLMR
ncbi:MAG: 3-deoxy-7-phosphoheptulonate synthase [Oligoflexia bacterium]|nr:3-deoxy-7-phosphoheptulonate synthase [Oligoflexia bacterium]